MKRLTISDPALVLALQDEIRRSEEARYDHRLHSVLLVAQGQSCSEVANSLGDSVRSVQYWVQRYEDRGFSGLQTEEKSGRPRLLTSQHLIRIEQVLRGSPRDSGMSVNLWDGKTLSAWIDRTLKVKIGVRQCQRMFRQLGLEVKKAAPNALSQE